MTLLDLAILMPSAFLIVLGLTLIIDAAFEAFVTSLENDT